MSVGRLVLVLGVCVWLADAPARVRAQSAPPATGVERTQEAQAQFARGLTLSAQEHWTEAHAAFRRSLELVPRASTYFNLALVCLELGLGGSALEALQAFEQLSAPDTEKARAQAAPLRERAKAHAGTLLLSVQPAQACVEIDGSARPSPQAEHVVLLDPGSHTLHVSAAGHASSQFSLEIVASAALHRRVELSPDSAIVLVPERVARAASPTVTPANAPLAAASAAPRAERSVWRNPWLWGVVGALVVGAAVTVAVVKLRPDDDAGCADCDVLQPEAH